MKITIAAVVAVAALGFTACSESKPAETTVETTSTTVETPAPVVEAPAPAADPAMTTPADPAAAPATTESTTTTTTTTPAETH